MTGAPEAVGVARNAVSYGLVTEKLTDHTSIQRRFTDEAGRSYILGEPARMGVDSAGKEDECWYHTDFYLSRPAGETEKPVEELLAPVL